MNEYGFVFLVALSYLLVFWVGVGSQEIDRLAMLGVILYIVAAGFMLYALSGAFGFPLP